MSPFRKNAKPEDAAPRFRLHPVLVGYLIIMAALLCMLTGALICGRALTKNSNVRQERNNAAAEAISATKRLYGVPPDATYCRPEVGSTVCAHMYPQGSNLCDVFVPNTGNIQLCCDTHDYRNNTGCSIRVLSLGDFQWRQATQ